MHLDIHSAVQTALVIAILAIIISFVIGFQSIRKARDLKFFRMRRDKMMRGWRLMFFSFVMVLFSLFLRSYAEPIVYRFYPPTATLTLTPTITITPTVTQTPTITLTPTISPTPSVTDTPTVTPTPHVPLAIESQFESEVTPSPDAVFSPLQFAEELDKDYNLIDPGVEFINPIKHMYAMFSYDKMMPGAQWTAIWYRNGELVYFETKPWDGNVGGLGYTDWGPSPDAWQPGLYDVQIFVGLDFKVSGQFTVTGDAPTAMPTITPSFTVTPLPSEAPTATATVPSTQLPSTTPRPPATLQPTNTSGPTATKSPTVTPTATKPAATHFPTWTPTATRPTATHAPTATEKPTPKP